MSSLHDTAVDCDDPTVIIPVMVQSLAAIANRLTLLREALELNQAEICRAIEVQPNRWNQYETGERRITLPVAAKLVDRYGVTLDYIYLGDPAGLPKRIVDRLETEAAQ